jgi:hypothetical protein
MNGKILSIISVSLFVTVFFGIYCFGSNEAYADGPTEVSGIYFSDVTWTLSESPYVVTDDVQIVNDATLTIEAGVNIQYSGAYEILIKGAIIANGEVSNPIIFNSSSADAISGARMLMFKDTDLSDSSLNHLVLENSDISVQIGEETEHNQGEKNNGTLTISHVKISNTIIITDGYDTGAKLTINDANIVSSTIRGTYPRSEEIIIKNSEISNCNIKSDSYNKGITIRDSTVTDSEFTIGCSPANIHIIDSTIKDSNIQEGGGNPVMGPLEITNSKMINTPVNLPAVTLEVSNSIISYSGSYCFIFGNGFIDNSLITGKGQGVALEITGKRGYYIGGNVSITSSTITYNSIGIRIKDFYVISIQNNNIYENALYNIENLAIKDVAAQDNFWGTTDTEEIGDLIFDYYDDINYGKVLNDQFLMDVLDFDSDKDGTKDSADTDDDNDGYLDDVDAFSLDLNEWLDTDGDGTGNNADTDDDNDGYLDDEDAFPLDPNDWVDSDNDGIGNNADTDDDNDGYLDDEDAFPFDPSEWLDTDSDGIGNNADSDDDNDGYSDDKDAFSLDPSEWLDTDIDGIGNNADSDDDNDGHLDEDDAFPLDPSRWKISQEGNGEGNGDDDPDEIDDTVDTDSDGYSDSVDAFPGNPNEWRDTDSDGIGNNADADDDGDGHLDEVDAYPLDKTRWAKSHEDSNNDWMLIALLEAVVIGILLISLIIVGLKLRRKDQV